MRRQCGLISVTALFLAIFGACSSGPTVDETTPVETTDERRQGASPPAEMVRAPAQIPADTELLWRGSQEQISNLLVRQMNLMRSAMGDQAMRAPERDDGVESTVANLSRELIAGTEINYVDKGLTFPGLKDDEDAFLAIRRLSDQPVLELVDWGAPLVAEDEPSVVFATRIFFPTDDPQALVDAVRDFCGDGDRCKYLLDLSTQEGFAMIDTVRASDFDADEWAVPATQTLDLEVRKTPASQAFLSPLHGVAVYIPSFRFADWAAVARLSRLVAFRAIYQGAPWGQILLEEGGTISRILSMTSPATQEVEDLSVGLRVGETEGIAAALATTHTRVGQQIFEAAEQQIMLPAIDVEEPAIELEWSADFDVAMDTAARPYWLGGTAQTARERWEHYLLDREFWLFAGVLFNQPVGLLKAAAAAFSEEGQIPFDLVRGLQSGRARLGFVADDSAAGGQRLAGGIVLAAQPGSPAAQRLREGIDELESQGLLAQFGLVANDSVIEGLDVVSIHDPELGDPFGELTAVEEFYALAEPNRLPTDILSLLPSGLGMMVSMPPTTQLSFETSLTGRTVDVQLGTASGDTLRPIASDIDLVQAGPLPECQRRAQALAAQIYQRIYPISAAEESPAAIIADARREFSNLRDDCDHEELDAVVEAWNEFDVESPELRQAEPNE